MILASDQFSPLFKTIQPHVQHDCCIPCGTPTIDDDTSTRHMPKISRRMMRMRVNKGK